MLDLPTLILNLRPDLRQLYSLKSKAQRDLFLAWLLETGLREYKALTDDPSFTSNLAQPNHGPRGCLTWLQHMVWLRRADVREAFPLPARLAELQQWFYTHGVEESPIWRFLTRDERCHVLAQPKPWPTRLKPVIAAQTPQHSKVLPLAERAFGVNVIGYAFGQLGIGEDARMATRALLAAEVPVTMLDFPPGRSVPQNDRSMARHVGKHGEFAINIFCMTAEETGRFYAERGGAQFRERYNIGYWPWELGKWPREWEMLVELVDEVWVSTQHTYAALAPVCKKPLFVMPLAVELGKVREFKSRAHARKHFDLPPDARLFCFSFDLNSSIHRKNPNACIDAFLKAFPAKTRGPDVGLVIKVHKPVGRNVAWAKLKKLAASDRRIRIIEGTLPRPELLALYQACDCFLSLHRAEGFGRGLAEALQLGLHVICTGYSGNVDFCTAPYADLVRYTLVKVRKHQYVHTQGQVWAEPDVAHAAQLMRAFATRPMGRRKTAWKQFSAAEVGNRYSQRLAEIGRLLARRAD